MERLELDFDVFRKKVGCFFSRSSGESDRRNFGEALVEKHGWDRRLVRFTSTNLNTRSFFQYINPKASDFYSNFRFYEIEARVFFGFNGEVVSKGLKKKKSAIPCAPGQSESYVGLMKRIKKRCDEMEAQKVLGEGVFAMVLRNRETFYQRIQQ